MKFVIAMSWLGACLAFGAPVADAAPAKHSAEHSAKHRVKAHKPLRGVIYGHRRIGGYSYKYSDVIDTRKFYDRSYGGPNSGGAIDHDFFWPRATAPHGGDTPYLH